MKLTSPGRNNWVADVTPDTNWVTFMGTWGTSTGGTPITSTVSEILHGGYVIQETSAEDRHAMVSAIFVYANTMLEHWIDAEKRYSRGQK
jgi:hypothetical protein